VAGHLTGIGAVSDAVLGYFDRGRRPTRATTRAGRPRSWALTANLALVDDEPFFHVHVALGLRDGSTRGGHLFEASVRPTVELVLTAYPRPLRRKTDRESGLPLLDP